MKPSLIALVTGIIVIFTGIILEINIRMFAGSVIEFRGLEATIVVIILIAGGLIAIGISLMYELIVRKYKRKSNS